MVDEVTDESVCCFEKWICVILNHYTGFVKIYYVNDCDLERRFCIPGRKFWEDPFN